MDPYEFAEPVEITKALDKAFWEGLRSAKWQERKGALQALKAAAGTPKIAPGDFVELLSELKKVLTKDSNLVCVTETVACLGVAGSLIHSQARRLHVHSMLESQLNGAACTVCLSGESPCMPSFC